MADDCTKGIIKSIISDCTTQPIAGLEVKAWVGNRSEMTFTYDVTNPSKITSIAVEVTKQLFTITGVKKLLNSGHDKVIETDRADRFTHYFNFQGFEFDAASVENLDSLDDIVVIVETKNKVDSADGTFRAYGPKFGLYPSTDTMRANDIGGARNIEVTSQEGEAEKHSQYNVLNVDYITTEAMLVALEAVQV